MQHKCGAIILGASPIALGVARSLGRHGIPVWVYGTDRSIAHFSRYAKRRVISDRDKHQLLLDDGRQYGLQGWVVFPVEDRYVELLSVHHQSLSSIYRVTTPPWDITKFALDKRLTYRKAAELGIAAPWTLVTDNPAELNVKDLPYPLILKPAINHHFFPQTNLKALAVDTASDFHEKFAQMNAHIPADEILIQERIPGGGENQFSCAALCKDGKVSAAFAAQRIRQVPLDFGIDSTLVQTTHQTIVETDGRKWLEAVGFDGMAEVEFKFDPRDGKYKILDVNVRPWAWHTLGKAAGIDFPYLLWRQKIGDPVSSIPAPRQATWIREIGDLTAIAKSPNRLDEIKKLVKAVRGRALVFATLDFRDPIPFPAHLLLRAWRLFPRRKRGWQKVVPSETPIV